MTELQVEAARGRNTFRYLEGGVLHRLDGPALVEDRRDFRKWDQSKKPAWKTYREWWIDGKKLDFGEVMKWYRRQGIKIDQRLDEDQQVMFKLRFG